VEQAIGMAEAKSKLSELVGQAKYGGETFILQRRGQPMAVLISVEEYEQLRAQAAAASGEWASSLPPELQRRQRILVERAQQLERQYGDPVDGLAALFSTLPPDEDEFWVQIQETQ
jgi:prevent-host-death family protein